MIGTDVLAGGGPDRGVWPKLKKLGCTAPADQIASPVSDTVTCARRGRPGSGGLGVGFKPALICRLLTSGDAIRKP